MPALFILAFVVLLLLPLGAAAILKPKSNKPLEIFSITSRHPRYFAQSFAEKFEKNIDSTKAGIRLSKDEGLIRSDSSQILPEVCDSVVYAQNETFRAVPGTVFNKEIFACQEAYFMHNNQMRAVYSKKHLLLGNGTKVLRWADSEESVSVYDHCELGLSLSSAGRVVVGIDCTFQRIFAPTIDLGASPETRILAQRSVARVCNVYSDAIFRNVQYIGDNLAHVDSLPDEHGMTHIIVNGSVITNHKVSMLERTELCGHIRTTKSATIYDNCIIHGNIFAEGDIYIGRNCRIMGNIFTQENLFIGQGVYIGQDGDIKSVVARGKITVEAQCRIHGYISTESQGLCCPDVDKYLYIAEEDRVPVVYTQGPYIKPPLSSDSPVAEFSSQEEFDFLGTTVFRKSTTLKEVIIPEGVTVIRPSLFFECVNLERVVLPSTLESIESFAFYGCKSLSEINFEDCTNLGKIGASAFYGCESLLEFNPPDPESLHTIQGAAFYGCSSLKSVAIDWNSRITRFEPHILYGCESLTAITLPEGLSYVGSSALYNCKSLRSIEIPASVSYIGGYAFCYCDSLTELVFNSQYLKNEDNILFGVPDDTNVIVRNENVRVTLQCTWNSGMYLEEGHVLAQATR